MLPPISVLFKRVIPIIKRRPRCSDAPAAIFDHRLAVVQVRLQRRSEIFSMLGMELDTVCQHLLQIRLGKLLRQHEQKCQVMYVNQEVWIMYINQASVGSYLVHVVPGGKASPNQTVVDEAKQLGPKYWDFLHNLTLFALVSVKASEAQGTEAQHSKVMVQATTHIFQSFSKAMSTSVGVVNAKALLSGPRVEDLHQNSTNM